MDWRLAIVELVLVKQQINDLDPEKLWEYRLPRVANTEAEIVRAEAALGERFAAQHREFLTFAGGWLAFRQDTALLGAPDFLGSAFLSRGNHLVRSLAPDVLQQIGLSENDVYTIAASRNDIDVFVVAREATPMAG